MVILMHKEHNQILLLEVENNLTKYGENKFGFNWNHACVHKVEEN
jgi:hypothetical protein